MLCACHFFARACAQGELITLKAVWDSATLVLSQFSVWKKTPWQEIDTSSIEEQCKDLTKEIRALKKNAGSAQHRPRTRKIPQTRARKRKRASPTQITHDNMLRKVDHSSLPLGGSGAQRIGFTRRNSSLAQRMGTYFCRHNPFSDTIFLKYSGGHLGRSEWNIASLPLLKSTYGVTAINFGRILLFTVLPRKIPSDSKLVGR